MQPPTASETRLNGPKLGDAAAAQDWSVQPPSARAICSGASHDETADSLRCPLAPRPGPNPSRRLTPRLKLCFITETMLTGVGRHVTDVVKGMAARGHEVHLLHSDTRVEERLLGELSGLKGVRCQSFCMPRQPHWSDLAILFALAGYLHRWGPFDVLHGQSSKGGAYARLLNVLVPGLCFYTPHSFITMAPHLSRPGHAACAVIEHCLALLTDRIVCCSEGERRHALGLGIRPERLSVVVNGLAPAGGGAVQDQRRCLPPPAPTVIIGFVGRMIEQKAPWRLVQAAATLVAQGKDIHVIMIGDGPLRMPLENWTRQLNCADRFSWCGATPASEWIARFDILAMSSLYEGCSYVLLEALQAGVPVVCTDVAGAEEAIEDGVNGFIVPQADPQALVGKLSLLVDDPDLRREMGRRAYARSARFSCDAMVDCLEGLYFADLMNGAGERSDGNVRTIDSAADELVNGMGGSPKPQRNTRLDQANRGL